MAIIADVTLPGSARIPNVYISPFRVAETPSGGEYELTYRHGGKDGPGIVIPPDFAFLTFLGGSRRFKSGVAFDRQKPNREQVYDDLRAKALAGELHWLTNIRNEDGSAFMEAPGKSETTSNQEGSLDAISETGDAGSATDGNPVPDPGDTVHGGNVDDGGLGDVFSGEEDINPLQVVEAERDEARESLKVANERIAELESREPEVRIERVEVERVVTVSSPEAAPLKIIPDEIAAMMDPGDTFSPEVRRKLTERLNVELAELKNLRGLAGEDLKREAEIEKLLGLFARLGEI